MIKLKFNVFFQWCIPPAPATQTGQYRGWPLYLYFLNGCRVSWFMKGSVWGKSVATMIGRLYHALPNLQLEAKKARGTRTLPIWLQTQCNIVTVLGFDKLTPGPNKKFKNSFFFLNSVDILNTMGAYCVLWGILSPSVAHLLLYIFATIIRKSSWRYTRSKRRLKRPKYTKALCSVRLRYPWKKYDKYEKV